MSGIMHELLKSYPVVIELPVLWGEMDAMAHVNNAVYFRYFESARVEYFGKIGFGRTSDTSPIGPILGTVRCRFRVPLTYPDTILVGARVIDIKADRFTMEHIVVSRSKDAVAAEGDGVIVSFNYEKNSKAPLPDPIKQRIQALETARKGPK
jgi:acyl-CoA thioester hydrolase